MAHDAIPAVARGHQHFVIVQSGRFLAHGLALGRLCVFVSTSCCVVSHASDMECCGMPTLDLGCLVLPVTCNA